jgi:hypothetical protein
MRLAKKRGLGGASADEFDDLSKPLIGNVKAALSGLNLTTSRLGNQVAELIHRRTAEEAVYAMLVLIDGVVRPLPAMRDQNPVPDNESLRRAIDKCKDEFQACFTMDVRWTSDGHPTGVRPTSDARPTDVQRISDARPTDVRQTTVGPPSQTSVGRPTGPESSANHGLPPASHR